MTNWYFKTGTSYLTSASLRIKLRPKSPLRRAVSYRSEAQHPLRRTVFSQVSNPKALNTTKHAHLNKRSDTMRAASPPVSVSFHRLSSTTTDIKFMFLRHARPTRLAAVCVLFTVALVMVPKADISETLFDEANTPTNAILVEKAASSWEHRQLDPSFVPRIFAQPRRTGVRRISPVQPSRLTDSRTFQELFCTFLC